MRVRFRSNQRRNNKTDQGVTLLSHNLPTGPISWQDMPHVLSSTGHKRCPQTAVPSSHRSHYAAGNSQPLIDDGPVVTFALLKLLASSRHTSSWNLTTGRHGARMTLHVQGLRGHTFLFIPLQRVHAIHVPVIHPAVLEGKVAAVLGQATTADNHLIVWCHL